MQHISRLLLAALLALTLDALLVSSRTPRNGVDPASLEDQDEPAVSDYKDISRPNPIPDFSSLNESGANEEGEEPLCKTSPHSQGCLRAKQEFEMGDAELRRVRIEVIKQQILQKLRLKAPPQVRLQRSGIPSLLLSNSEALFEITETELGDTLESSSYSLHRRSHSRSHPPTPPKEDNFYGTTKNVFIFPDNSTATQVRCSTSSSSICLSFRLSQEVLSGSLTSSHIWLYKQAVPSPTLGTPAISNQTLVVSEIVYDRQFAITRKRILAVEDEDHGRSSGGWVRFHVDRAVRRWVTKPHLVHALEISCKGCSQFPVPVSQAENQQPFLVLTVGPQHTLTRRRREVDCTNTTTRCCRESFYLSFKEIGWDEWILQPLGYTANFCKGSCLNDVSTSRYHHTTVLNRFLQNQRGSNEPPMFTLCCTPSKMSPISLIYVDEDNNLFQKSLPNMVVESCDCA